MGGDLTGPWLIIERVFDDRGPAQRRNDRSGALQRTRVRRIWVDLAVAYPRPEDRPVRVFPEGVDLQSRVPGELLAWCRATTGEWVGWVCLPIHHGDQVRYVYTYVVADAMTPRDDVPDKRRG